MNNETYLLNTKSNNPMTSKLDSLTLNDIDSDIQLFLYANINKYLTDSELYSKLLKKYINENENENEFVSPLLKKKFLRVILNLKNRKSYIRVENENCHYKLVAFNDDFENENKKETKKECNEKFNLWDCLYDVSDKYDYMTDYINHNDGNTYYHEIVLLSNEKLIETLVNHNKFNSFVANNNNKIPIELTTNQKIITILIRALKHEYNEILNLNDCLSNENKQLKNKKLDNNESDDLVDYYYNILNPNKFFVLIMILTSMIIFLLYASS